jgi:hypothetical protein
MHRCTSTFEADGVKYVGGRTRVAADHQVLRTHSDKFVEDASGPISGAQGELRELTPVETQRVEEIIARHPARRECSDTNPRERVRRARTQPLTDPRRQLCQRRGARKKGTQR